jgi:hypothetical protein
MSCLPHLPDSGDNGRSASTSIPTAPLERLLAAVETELSDLGSALHRRDSCAIEEHAQALRVALEQAVDGFSRAARGSQGVPPALRNRLMNASGEVAAQRESLARATVALDHAMDVLMPAGAGGSSFYGPQGQRTRSLYPS